MSLNEQILKRFAKLEAQGRALPVKRAAPGDGSDTIDSEAFQHWASSTMHLVASVFGVHFAENVVFPQHAKVIWSRVLPTAEVTYETGVEAVYLRCCDNLD